jgi:hypothetical protein
LIAAIVSIPYTVWRKRRHAQPSLEEETMQPT